MGSEPFFIALTILWLGARLLLWRRSNRNAVLRLSQGEIELAYGHVIKQPIIYVAVCTVICVELLRTERTADPIVVYIGLATWSLGLALLIRDLQNSSRLWTERLFRPVSNSGKPVIEEDISPRPWIPWWPLRLELVGLALFCGAPLGALAAWVFCVAYARAIKNAVFEE